MELVVDTNVVFSLFKKDSFTRRLIEKHNLKLFSPETLIKELDKYCREICSKGKISQGTFKEAEQSVLAIVKILPESKEQLSKAKSLISDQSDVPFLALSLELNKMPIWSNDKHFKTQSLVRVFSTEELDKFLKRSSST